MTEDNQLTFQRVFSKLNMKHGRWLRGKTLITHKHDLNLDPRMQTQLDIAIASLIPAFLNGEGEVEREGPLGCSLAS